jgi:Arc/MetJ-type ribon-helix-helix transcriptional regulator
MTLDVPAEYENVIRKAVASGAFKSPEEAMRHAFALLEREQRVGDSFEGSSKADDVLEVLPEDLDPRAVAKMQGIGPIQDPDAGAADSWPEGEDFDEWMADLRHLRGQGVPRELS